MATYIIGGLVLIAFVFAIYRSYKKQKDCPCSGCPAAGKCDGNC